MTDEEKTAFETLTQSFTKMETLYKIKCNEVEVKQNKIKCLEAENAKLNETLIRVKSERVSKLKSENAELRARLDKAVELPRIEISQYDENDTLLYYIENGHIQQECFNNKFPEQLQKRLAELKGNK